MEFDANFSQPASKKQNADQTDQTRQTWKGRGGGKCAKPKTSSVHLRGAGDVMSCWDHPEVNKQSKFKH